MISKALPLAVLIVLHAWPVRADPPDFSVSFDLGPSADIDIPSGETDSQGSASVNGTMSGSFDNGVGYSLGADAIFERHVDFTTRDTNYLKVSGLLSYQTDLGKLSLRASNLSVFDRHFEAMNFNLTDVSLGVDRGFDLTDDIRMRLAVNGARRFELTQALDRYSINPSVSFTSTFLGLDANLSASYSYRDFVFRDRVDHYFGTGLTLSKTFDMVTIGMSANLDVTRSSVAALSYTSFIVGPNLTLTFPVE